MSCQEEAIVYTGSIPHAAEVVVRAVKQLEEMSRAAGTMSKKASKDPVERGALALWDAFPTLREDFTWEWFLKASQIVIAASINPYKEPGV